MSLPVIRVTGGFHVRSTIREFHGRKWSQYSRSDSWQSATEQWFPSARSEECADARDPSARDRSDASDPSAVADARGAVPVTVRGDVEGRRARTPSIKWFPTVGNQMRDGVYFLFNLRED